MSFRIWAEVKRAALRDRSHQIRGARIAKVSTPRIEERHRSRILANAVEADIEAALANEPRKAAFAPTRRQAIAGAAASFLAMCAVPHGAKAQSALAEPWGSTNGLHTDWNGRLTSLPMRGAGGFGDGNSHPCGTVVGAKIPGYGSMSGAAQLAAIQAYPYISCQYATTTSDEMDLLAFRALAAKAIATGGDTIKPEAGTWMFSSALPDVPAASDDYVYTRQATYSIDAAGSAVCVFKFMNDVSTGYGSAFALKVANRTNADGTNYSGLWKGFALVGPGTTITPGTKNCQLSGLGWGARRSMIDVHVYGFYQGACVQGDQTKFDRILISHCSFGMEWDLANGTLFGDFQIDRSLFVNCAFACVSASPVSQIPKVTWNKPIFATSPICFAKRVNTGATGWQPNFLFENRMFGPQFEQYGYAAVAEIDATTLLPNPTAGSYNANILVACQLLRAEFGPIQTTYKFPTLNPSVGLFEGQNMLARNIVELSIEGNLQPGSNGLLNVISFGLQGALDKTTIRGDLDTVLGNLRAITNTSGYQRSLILGTTASDPEHLIFESSAWAGKMFYDGTGLQPAVNTVVALNDGFAFHAAAGTTADATMGTGVVKFRRTDGVSAGTEVYILMATRGANTVLGGTSSWSNDGLLRTTSGYPTTASGPYDQTSYVFGQAIGNSSGTSPNITGTVRLFEKVNWIDT